MYSLPRSGTILPTDITLSLLRTHSDPPDEPVDSIYKPVKYGEIDDDTVNGGGRRAAFSSRKVGPLVAGQWYDARPASPANEEDAGSDSEVTYERPETATLYTHLDSESGDVQNQLSPRR